MTDEIRNYLCFLIRSNFRGCVEIVSAVNISAYSVPWKYL